jgi:protein gp37
MAKSKIEWTQITWNPTTGCNKVSAGCKYCYAEAMSKRLQAMGLAKYADGFALRLHYDELIKPYGWKTPKMVFVNSMSDLFHEGVPISFIQQVFQIMRDNSKHTFQVLTKRAERLARYSADLKWTDNIWAGVSVEDGQAMYRIDYLRQTGARIKFLSCEPLLSRLPNLDLTGIDWVIVGGESGRNPRPMRPEWVMEIQERCEKAGVPFFFKQWGGRNKKQNGRHLNGKIYDEMPIWR